LPPGPTGLPPWPDFRRIVPARTFVGSSRPIGQAVARHQTPPISPIVERLRRPWRDMRPQARSGTRGQ
jgi:hypothetical protein